MNNINEIYRILGRKEIWLTRHLHETLNRDLPKNYKEKILDTLLFFLRMTKNLKETENPIERAVNVLHTIDTLIEQEKKSAAKSAALISCKKGCSFCCSMEVEITEDEAVLIHSLNISMDRAVLDRQAKAEDWVFLARTSKEKCIFLQKDGACKIYDWRPSACRRYFSISDPKLCEIKDKPVIIGKFVPMGAEIFMSAVINFIRLGRMSRMLLDHKGASRENGDERPIKSNMIEKTPPTGSFVGKLASSDN